jgi:aspartyl-tRNA(Asn)/glutamyl-tRNA(Gln) amidotransferase subunit A
LDLTQLTIMETAKKLREKEFSVSELVSAYLNRIQKHDASIGAYITVCSENAIQQAEAMQEKINANEDVPVLTGIPLGLKDNIVTRGLLTSCGS